MVVVVVKVRERERERQKERERAGISLQSPPPESPNMTEAYPNRRAKETRTLSRPSARFPCPCRTLHTTTGSNRPSSDVATSVSGSVSGTSTTVSRDSATICRSHQETRTSDSARWRLSATPSATSNTSRHSWPTQTTKTRRRRRKTGSRHQANDVRWDWHIGCVGD